MILSRIARFTIAPVALTLSLASASLASDASEIQVHLKPKGLDENGVRILTLLASERASLEEILRGRQYRILHAEFGEISATESDMKRLDLPGLDASSFRLTVYDYTMDRMLEFSGDFRTDRAVTMGASDRRIEATPDEIIAAHEIIQRSSEFGRLHKQGAFQFYESMPGILDGYKERVIPVGLMPLRADFKHEIVGVDLSRGRILRYPNAAPPTTLAKARVCSPPTAGQANTRRGTPGQAELVVEKAGRILWKMTVVRPSASSGAYGSGVEVRNVEYLGKKVLAQAHVPLLNVQYDRNRCGPFRDWQYSESPFQARGDLIASGILKATENPTTIHDTGSDRGNFRGVAVYTEGPETILVSELSAGWYRYRTEFRFHEDGSIRPRWGFSAIQDSCTCNNHTHHAYLRLDFDVGSDRANQVEVSDGTAWRPVAKEARFVRGGSNRSWRVSQPLTGEGYEIIPNVDDGVTDAFGRGDVWAVQYARGQIDDTNYPHGFPVNLDAFVNGQSLDRQDSVIWYAIHFYHETLNGAQGCQKFAHGSGGPTLRPVGW